MSDWPVGLSTGCFHEVAILDCLEDVRRGGFLMIEVCSGPRHLDYNDARAVERAARLIDDLGMEAYSFHAPFDRSIDITAREDDRRRHALDEIMRAAEAAARMHTRYFVIHPGPERSDGHTDEERLPALKRAAEVLRTIAGRCRELGVGLVLENMLPHLLFGNTTDMLWILGAIESASPGTCLDTGHANLTGDIESVMYKLSGHLQMLHANDNRGDGDDHLPPGKGGIEWRDLLSRLDRTGFSGGIILELSSEVGDTRERILEEARGARRLIRDISRELQLSHPPTGR
jgi:sugar phosphate isomerase/epimerase